MEVNIVKQYQFARYQDCGRGNGVYDCWGLVREVLNTYFGKPLAASFGSVLPSNKQAMQQVSEHIIQENNFILCEPELGAVACLYRGKVLHHVGILVTVNNKLQVLDASNAHGIGIRSIKDFKQQGSVRFYKCQQ